MSVETAVEKVAVHLGQPMTDLDTTYRLAKNLAVASVMPNDLRGKPSDVLAIVLYGNDLGLSPMQSIQGIYVVKGKPQLSSTLWTALARRAGHKVRWGDCDDKSATVTIVRADDPDFPHTETFTIEDAGGYGGLDMGVQAAIGGTVAWHCEFDPAASKVLAHHWPDIPNLGDITTVDWAAVEPVDVLTGGSPCQDVSHAGKRAGMKAGTRSGLWASMCDAIDVLRPSLVIWENVRGVLGAEADSALEPCAGCVGDGSGTVLRALGRVLGDLADLGYVGGWCGVRAADVGACHGRSRVFVAAWPAADVPNIGRERLGGGSSGDLMLPSAVTLLPTPAVNDMGEGKTPEAWDAWTAAMKERHGNGNGHGHSLAIEAQRLLPTPQAHDAQGPKSPEQVASMRDQGFGVANLNEAVIHDANRWGEYAAAIHRHEHTFGRQAPPPTQPSRKGTPQLSPRFSEWMMCLPEGHVTEVPGLTRNEKLKILGNGVVPAQAAAAVAHLLNALEVAA